MTHQNDYNLSSNLAETLLANGLDGMSSPETDLQIQFVLKWQSLYNS